MINRLKVLAVFIFLFIYTVPVTASDNVIYFNNSSRPLGMGGAFTAVADEQRNHLYNPAATVFHNSEKFQTAITLDGIRFVYVFAKMLESYNDSGTTLEEEEIGAALFTAMILSTSQLLAGNRYFQIKLNVIDQMLVNGLEYPMYSTSVTAVAKLYGIFYGFQIGVTGHLYNLGSIDQEGAGFSWGIFYRPYNRSPFSLGLFYFSVDKELAFIRKPFERIQNNTLNAGITYEILEQLTLNFDLRNINNIKLKNYYQPHIGLELVFPRNTSEFEGYRVELRGGTYYDSEPKSQGYSFGFNIKVYMDEGHLNQVFQNKKEGSYFYLGYSFTTEENVYPSKNNHIISIGGTFFL